MSLHVPTSSIWRCTVIFVLGVIAALVGLAGVVILIRLTPFGGGAWLWTSIGVLFLGSCLIVAETYAQWQHLLFLRRNSRIPSDSVPGR